MSLYHQLNIALHVSLGTIALLVGIGALLTQHKAKLHRRIGRVFLWLLSGVVGTALLGALLFRVTPFLLMLTLLSGYVGYSGYRVVRLRERRASGWDALIALVVLLAAGAYVTTHGGQGRNWSPAVIMPTLGAIGLVTVYDLIKFAWLHSRLRTWWLYEHIYKLISAFSALLSAFSGTVLPQFKPYSQIMPSAFCLGLIAYFIWKRARRSRPQAVTAPVRRPVAVKKPGQP